jgi:diguanylate cyclase (GGDEF)-like protein/PAS domain S-box-containing protein
MEKNGLLERYVPQILDFFNGLSCIFILLDEEFNIVYANNGAKKFFEYYQGESVQGKNLFKVFSELDYLFVRYHLDNGMTYQTKYFYSYGNKKRVLIIRISELKTEGERIFLLLGQDITDFLRLSFNIEFTSKFDKKTKLLSLLPFLDLSQQEIFSLSEVKKEERWYAGILVLDLYNFSVVNNLYGLQAGDEILKEIAQRLVRVLGKDRVGKGAADEFVIFISGLSRKENIWEYLKMIDFVFELPFYINEKKIRVYYNLGVAIYPCDGKDVEVLFQKARLACNFAKRRGTNQVIFFEEGLSEEMQRRFFIENLLNEAFNNDWFIFFVQPYFGRRDLKLAGVEALARIKTIDGTLFLPGHFIPILETSHYLKKFEGLVFEKVLSLQRGLRLPVSLNITPSTFCELKFFEERQEKIEALEYPLILEITERGAIEKPQQVKETLNFLKKFPQLKIAIDDFGTGYNGLIYLKDIFEDMEGVIVKIDTAFVRELDYKNLKVMELIKAIINLAHNLGAETLAEGVETEEQARILCDLGCDYLQGYYFERPISVEEFKEKYCL